MNLFESKLYKEGVPEAQPFRHFWNGSFNSSADRWRTSNLREPQPKVQFNAKRLLLTSTRWLHQTQIWSCHCARCHPTLHTLHTTHHTPSNRHSDVSESVWMSPGASFSSSSICAGNLSYEPVSSEAREHLEPWAERQDNTLKASCSVLIAHGSIPAISHFSPYLLYFIAKAWRPLDSWEKCIKLGMTWPILAISAYLQLPLEASLLNVKNISMTVDFELFFILSGRPNMLKSTCWIYDTADQSSRQLCNHCSLMCRPDVGTFACYQAAKT